MSLPAPSRVTRRYNNQTYIFAAQADSGTDATIIGMNQQIPQSEANRIRSKTYVDGGQSVSGSAYLSNVGGRDFVSIGQYEKSSNGAWGYLPTSVGLESTYLNVNNSINSDLELKKLLTTKPNVQDQNSQTQPQQTSTPILNTDANNVPSKFDPLSGLVYPIDARANGQDMIKFVAVEYQASGVTQEANAGTTGANGLPATTGLLNVNRKNLQGKTSKGTVFLPIQASITDQNGVEWGGASLNEIERFLANLSLGAMETKSEDFTKYLQNQLGKAISEVSKSAPQIRTAIAGEAVGIQNLLSRFGQILNPNLELLFTGPTLRPFNFSFKMSARSQKEGEEIRNIINFFKKNMAPKGKAGEIFLRSPNTFFIEYNTYDNNGQLITHPSMNLIKECALTNCSVDYTPMGTHMTYEDNMRTLVSYNMTLTFQELEPIYDGDYAESNNIQY
jgi:hypothetical protein